jgi:dTMP kinase
MFDLPMKFAQGRLVVFEGLDDTGKTTQLDRFEEACYHPQGGDAIYDPKPLFTRQPADAPGIGPEIYELTERVDWSTASPLTRQLLHLAAHSEHYEHKVLPAIEDGSVIMDRCWWSTMAYGYRGSVSDDISWEDFMRLTQLPARHCMPDLVFLFTHRHGRKASSKHTGADKITRRNYFRLMEEFTDTTVLVPDVGAGEVTAFIAGVLNERGITEIKKGKR